MALKSEEETPAGCHGENSPEALGFYIVKKIFIEFKDLVDLLNLNPNPVLNHQARELSPIN